MLVIEIDMATFGRLSPPYDKSVDVMYCMALMVKSSGALNAGAYGKQLVVRVDAEIVKIADIDGVVFQWGAPISDKCGWCDGRGRISKQEYEEICNSRN